MGGGGCRSLWCRCSVLEYVNGGVCAVMRPSGEGGKGAEPSLNKRSQLIHRGYLNKGSPHRTEKEVIPVTQGQKHQSFPVFFDWKSALIESPGPERFTATLDWKSTS